MDTLAFVTAELQAKQTSLDRLRRLLFGAPTETTRTIVGPSPPPGAPGPGPSSSAEAGPAAGTPRPGHGRTGAAAYTGADTVTIAHPSLHRGDGCPGCLTGKIYPLAEPATRVRITGMAPLGATVYACERWRGNLCGEVFTAPAPAGVGDAKYDATATSMVGLLKYGCGLPFHRIEILQRGLRIPLPAATQWELVRDALPQLVPAWDELLRQAAQGEVVYNDDTTMKVLALTAEQRRAAGADEETDARTGVFTSGIVATGAGHHIALFCTGRQHAGENLAAVLAQRAAADPEVRRARRQHRGRLRHAPRPLPGPCAPPLRRGGRPLPRGGPAPPRDLARGLPHRRPRARACAVTRRATAPPPDRERPADGGP